MGPPGQPAGRPIVVAAFLGLALCTQMLLAMYGLLSRWLQVKAAPPVPALRLVVVSNLFAEAFMVAFHLAPKLLLAWVRQQRQRRQRRRLAGASSSLPVTAAAQLEAGEEKAAAKTAGDSCCTSEDGASGGSPSEGQPESQQQGSACPAAAAEAGRGAAPTGPQGSGNGSAKPRLAPAPSTVRPPVPLLRGLSRKMEQWEEERPVLRRRLALAAITVTFMGCCSLQILAPGFVDVSIVMLTTQWTTLCIALAQAFLLRHRLPAAFWPAAAVMLAGAAMVIAPSVGQSTAGSLNTVRGWMGFLMAIGALISTVIYYVLLQATRHMGFSPLQLQHCMNTLSVLVFLCISLPVDGTDWGATFGHWGSTDWLALIGLSSAAYLGSGMCMQLCVWKLGAPTAAMFFGLRLVFSVALSTPILGSTIIQTGVQIAGVVLTSVAVTCYAGSQWWASRRQQQQAGLAPPRQREQELQQQGPAAAGAAADAAET